MYPEGYIWERFREEEGKVFKKRMKRVFKKRMKRFPGYVRIWF
jgi:hypothetical protein